MTNGSEKHIFFLSIRQLVFSRRWCVTHQGSQMDHGLHQELPSDQIWLTTTYNAYSYSEQIFLVENINLQCTLSWLRTLIYNVQEDLLTVWLNESRHIDLHVWLHGSRLWDIIFAAYSRIVEKNTFRVATQISEWVAFAPICNIHSYVDVATLAIFV